MQNKVLKSEGYFDELIDPGGRMPKRVNYIRKCDFIK